MKKVKNPLAGLASRKDRREAARLKGEKFVPQYNGQEPMRVQHKDVLKHEINADKRKAKGREY